MVNPHLEREGDQRRLLPTETELSPRRGPASWLGRRRFQIIVTVLLVTTSPTVFVVAIGVFVALTLHKWESIKVAGPSTGSS